MTVQTNFCALSMCLPAILIGGPPKVGKSVLTYNLTRELRRFNIPHYVFRASADIVIKQAKIGANNAPYSEEIIHLPHRLTALPLSHSVQWLWRSQGDNGETHARYTSDRQDQ